MNEFTEANRRHWDEVVPIHVRSEMYDVASFKAGESRLKPVEREELGDVRGKTLLHLQCHFGLDTLSWAREGAVVTGIDFSEPAIEAARALAAETGIDARFIVSELYALPEVLDEQFDIVFTSYGALCWLADIDRWAEIAAHFLRPGGTFYVVEFHAMAGVFDETPTVTDLHVRYPYFETEEPLRFDEDGTYADRAAQIVSKTTYSWPHPTSDVVSALIDAGLRIDFFHEFPFTTEAWFPFMEEAGHRMFRLTKHDGCVPLLYSIRATKHGLSS
jgi:ubiquinone/menaquinone biosynthesis C-methylase UbiE